jgi:hypothetical protein
MGPHDKVTDPGAIQRLIVTVLGLGLDEKLVYFDNGMKFLATKKDDLHSHPAILIWLEELAAKQLALSKDAAPGLVCRVPAWVSLLTLTVLKHFNVYGQEEPHLICLRHALRMKDEPDRIDALWSLYLLSEGDTAKLWGFLNA